MGRGAFSISRIGQTIFLSNWSLDNLDGRSHIKISKINENGSFITNTDSLHFTDRHIFTRGFKRSISGFIQASTIESYNPLRSQFGIVKYDSSGLIISHNIDSIEYIYIYISDIQEIPNKNIILVGNIQYDSTDIQKGKIVLIKSDSLGNKLWLKSYNFNGIAHNGNSIALCKDGGFIIGGAQIDYNQVPSFTKPLVIKVDSLGNVQWRRTYGSTDFGNTPAYGITQTQDGFAFVGGVGLRSSGQEDLRAPWIVKTDSNGSIIWSDTNTPKTPNLYDQYYNDIIELPDESLVICGQRHVWVPEVVEPAKFRLKGVIAKYSKSGTLKWKRNYQHPEAVDLFSTSHYLYDIKPTPDGGFVDAGYLTPSIDTTQDTWVIKVDSFGCLVQGCEVTSVPEINASISALKIYPNPANAILNIDITPAAFEDLRQPGVQQEFVLELYDILGKLVLTKTLYPHENTITISHLKTGVYSYRIGEVWGQIIVK